MKERSLDQFSKYPVRLGSACWQIDSDELPSHLGDGNWEDKLAEILVDLAEAHEGSDLLCATDAGQSVDFGHAGFSVWIACAGSPPMVKACRDLIQELIPSGQLRQDVVHHEQHWSERIRIADGKVWRPVDSVTWKELDCDSLSMEDWIASAVEDDGEDAEFEGADAAPSAQDQVEATAPRKRKMYTARNDVKVSYYQRKVEKMLGLPEGSVKFVNPDRSISSANQLIRSLRSRWEE